jgi:2-polyprenyl-3-methyl-5-hydroxy-6-metoxy-1,4-benzoquinol methylase
MQTVSCNLCKSKEFEPLYQLPDLLLERDDLQTTLVRCVGCGLVYQNPRPTIEEMVVHYPSEYESYTSNPNYEKISWLLRKAYQYGIDKRGRILTRHKKSGRLLDVGCATGIFLAGIKANPGWELYGVEINEHAASIAREQHRLNVATGTLEDVEYPTDFFDAVTLWDVLEHLHDPSKSLIEISRILKKDGVLIIRVPNLSSWDAKLFGSSWAGLDAPRHLYVYDPHTLSRLLHKTNFDILRMGCDIGSYTTFILSLRFWLLAKGVRKPTRESISRILYHPFMRIISAPFFYAYGLGLRGPLLTVVAINREM